MRRTEEKPRKRKVTGDYASNDHERLHGCSVIASPTRSSRKSVQAPHSNAERKNIEIRVRAERRAEQLLAELELGHRPGRVKKNSHADESFFCDACNVEFDTKVWCCPKCRHHWGPAQDCKNCQGLPE
jgi:hypothetical protein